MNILIGLDSEWALLNWWSALDLGLCRAGHGLCRCYLSWAHLSLKPGLTHLTPLLRNVAVIFNNSQSRVDPNNVQEEEIVSFHWDKINYGWNQWWLRSLLTSSLSLYFSHSIVVAFTLLPLTKSMLSLTELMLMRHIVNDESGVMIRSNQCWNALMHILFQALMKWNGQQILSLNNVRYGHVFGYESMLTCSMSNISLFKRILNH